MYIRTLEKNEKCSGRDVRKNAERIFHSLRTGEGGRMPKFARVRSNAPNVVSSFRDGAESEGGARR